MAVHSQAGVLKGDRRAEYTPHHRVEKEVEGRRVYVWSPRVSLVEQPKPLIAPETKKGNGDLAWA